MSAPTPEQVSAAREFCAEHSDANPEHFAKWLAAREAAAYARGVEEAAKVADEAERTHRRDADGASKAEQYGRWSASDGAAITAEVVAREIRALLPGTAGAGSDNKDGAE